MDALSADDMRDALEDLSEELRRDGVKTRLYLVGGAAITMAFRDSRQTYDLDTLIVEGRGPVTEAARRIARKRGWPETWLNEGAVPYMGELPDRKARTVFGTANLVVTAASAEFLLAMKVRAGRAIDLDEIALLADELGLRTAREVYDVHEKSSPQCRFCHARIRLSGSFWPRAGRGIDRSSSSDDAASCNRADVSSGNSGTP